MLHAKTRFAGIAGALAALAAAAFAPSAGAQPFGLPDDPRIDADTGRDVSHWPHPRPFDHLHMRLEIDIPDMRVPQFTGRETITITPIGQDRLALRLDAVRMTIQSVSMGGRPQAFTHDGAELNILFDHPIRLGESADVTIDYLLQYPNNNGVGLTWTPGKPDGANETARSPQIHTQGQPEASRQWFPCHDFPNERLSTELIVTLPDGFEVCSNGHLAEMSSVPDGRVRWHWVQNEPIPNYLVVMVVGRFDVVDLGSIDLPPGPDGGPVRSLPIRVYTTAGSADEVRNSFGRTPEMIAHFSELFGEPFPWDKYDQLIVRNFAAGAMENASATTFAPMFSGTPREAAEGTIAHELVHQWLGDLLTYKSWAHTWLSEGWASMGEALWAEASAPEGQKRRAYQRTIAGFFARQSGFNRAYAPTYPSMVSNRYPSPDSVFMKTDDVYSKGALVLHMLRMRLGDDLFFAGTRLYIQRFKFKEVETDDFRHCLEEVSGESLERFFDQWTARPGLPRLKINVSWEASTSRLHIIADQTQHLDADNPAYAFELPILIKFKDKPSQTQFLVMDTRHAEDSWNLPDPPVDVVVDPSMTVAAPAEVTKSLPEAAPEPPPEGAPPPEAQPQAVTPTEPPATEGSH